MVLGLRSKSRKVAAVQVDYIIHLQEVKPWPPSQSLRSLRSIVLQWENGDRSSGSTNLVAPSVAEGRIEFNESFKLHATLTKEASRGHGSGQFHKNLLEFSLFEPKKDKAAKGQLLASAAVDLSEHAILKEAVIVGLPLNYKRSYRNAANSMLYVKIQPYDKESSTSSSRGSLSKEASPDRDGSESVSAMMTGEYADEAEIASFTDDDVSSSHSSLNQNFRSPGKQVVNENVPEATNKSERLNDKFASASSPVKPEVEPVVKPYASNHAQNGSSPESSVPKSPSDLESLDNADSVVSGTLQRSPTHILEDSDSPVLYSNSERLEGLKQEHKVSKIDASVEKDGLLQQVKGSGEKSVTENNINKDIGINVTIENDLPRENLDPASVLEHKPEVNKDENLQDIQDASDEVASTHPVHEMMEVNTGEKSGEANEIEPSTDRPKNQSIESATIVVRTPVLRPHFRRHTTKELPHEMPTVGQRLISEKVNGLIRSDVSKTRKLSVRSNPESLGGFRYPANDQCAEDVKEIDVQDVRDAGSTSNTDDTSLCSDQVNHVPGNNKTNSSDDKVRELELKVEMLEAELREAAAIEAGLYCVVAVHGSSAQKVHTPARRLSRLYIHASKHWSPERKASAARSSVSGLFLAAKACGNDVPRLMFWLSNSVVLRAVTAQSIGYSDHPISVDDYSASNGSEVMPKRRASSLKWESVQKKEFSFTEDLGNWEDPNTFMSALERIEGWIFSRIVESIWWQTFTPHMQMINESSELKASKKSYGRRPSLGDQKRANSSIEIWKRAFKDACERLCPVRAGGHECGCLPMLARMIMEQCVARLDVAMFNAILRESDDDIPNNPLSDPISDSKVLPIPSGKLSFGAGAQLKNAIGNWSRWLTDLFGMDEDDNPQDENDQESDRPNLAASFMSFRLLYALSDLLMLPKDMLLDRTIWKEVCPTFSASVIKRILHSFQPDEFCPDPIPEAVLEALDSEEPLDDGEEGIRNFPCDASPVIYSSPSIDLIESIVGDVQSPSMLRRSVSSVIRKCHTSDDELDELDSPLNSVIIEKSTPTALSKRNTVRYQLLREVWRENN